MLHNLGRVVATAAVAASVPHPLITSLLDRNGRGLPWAPAFLPCLPCNTEPMLPTSAEWWPQQLLHPL